MGSHNGALKPLKDQIKAQQICIFWGLAENEPPARALWQFSLCVDLKWKQRLSTLCRNALITFRDGMSLGQPKHGLSAVPDINQGQGKVSVGRLEKDFSWPQLVHKTRRRKFCCKNGGGRDTITFPSVSFKGKAYLHRQNANFFRNKSYWQMIK